MEKRPELIISVGSFYYADNTPTEGLDYDSAKYGAVHHSPVIKKVGIKESVDNQPVRASGKDYMSVSSKDSEEISVEVVAFDPDDLAKYRGDTVTTSGLILDDVAPKKPFFGMGFPIEKTNGKLDLVWYPKCQLVENTADVESKEDKFKEQNRTLTIKAYSFNGKNIKVHCDMESSNFPKDLTEEKFFSKVITCDEDLANVLTPDTPSGA